jgi:hypothetical protein
MQIRSELYVVMKSVLAKENISTPCMDGALKILGWIDLFRRGCFAPSAVPSLAPFG